MDPTVKVIIIIIIVIAAIYFVNSLHVTQNIDTFVQSEYPVPLKDAYKPLLSAPDDRYVYYPDGNVYLLPYDYLDFNDPYHRWLYYFFPGFYYDYYPDYFPYYGGLGSYGNYGGYYGGFIYDGHINRQRGRGNRITYPGGSDHSGRGIHHPIGHPGRPIGHGGHPGSGGGRPSGHGGHPGFGGGRPGSGGGRSGGSGRGH